jgi:hypothetical protein
MLAPSMCREESTVVPKMRFAIISDPHALTGELHRHETHARIETADDPTRNPFAAIRQLIHDSKSGGEPLVADVLLCPGDLANRHDEGGLEYAWREIEQIAKLLGASRIVATAGNHDVVRYEDLPPGTSEDYWIAALKGLKPTFPSDDVDDAKTYFLDDFVVTEGADWRVVALNSCASYSEKNEAWHGKIEPKTLELLGKTIKGERKQINILMCHHHPVEWTHLSREDTSFMHGGERLLVTLEEDDPARWILLHGHRHVPALGYAGESGSGPVRLSAGSLGVWLRQDARENVANQFYLLDFDLDETTELNLCGAGRFRAWNWESGQGMAAALQSAELPGRGGFGFRRHAHELAQMCRDRATEIGLRSVTWDELVDGDARWLYVIPRDLVMLRRTLELDNVLVEPLFGEANIERVSFGG